VLEEHTVQEESEVPEKGTPLEEGTVEHNHKE